MVKLQGRALLLNAAFIDEDNSVGKGHGLCLVMSYVKHSNAQFAVQIGELYTHGSAKLGIKV